MCLTRMPAGTCSKCASGRPRRCAKVFTATRMSMRFERRAAGSAAGSEAGLEDERQHHAAGEHREGGVGFVGQHPVDDELGEQRTARPTA